LFLKLDEINEPPPPQEHLETWFLDIDTFFKRVLALSHYTTL